MCHDEPKGVSRRSPMRKSLILIIGLVCAGSLILACEQSEPNVEYAGLMPIPAGLSLVASQDTAFRCEDATLIRLEDLPVTVRGGRMAAAGGWVGVWSRDPDLEDGLMKFTRPEQEFLRDPRIELDSMGRPSFRIDGRPNEKLEGPGGPYAKTISLARCSDHEGRLVRIHVDGANEGAWDFGPPKITVIGIYDRLTTPAALFDQAYECKRCGRVEVCGVDPGC